MLIGVLEKMDLHFLRRRYSLWAIPGTDFFSDSALACFASFVGPKETHHVPSLVVQPCHHRVWLLQIHESKGLCNLDFGELWI